MSENSTDNDQTPASLGLTWLNGGILAQYEPLGQMICVMERHDIDRLVGLVRRERDRCLNEILEDFGNDPDIGLEEIVSFEVLQDHCDANVYPAGGRSNGEYGDEKSGWSDQKTNEHEARLLSEGIIASGTGEKLDPNALSGSAAYAGFLNVLMDEVSVALKNGWLMENAQSSTPVPGR